MPHDKVIAALINCGVPDVEALGDSLRNMKNERRRADYFLEETVTKQDSEDQVCDAEDLLADIDQVTQPTIIEAVSAHLKRPFPIQ